jgi:hypothetical protein
MELLIIRHGLPVRRELTEGPADPELAVDGRIVRPPISPTTSPPNASMPSTPARSPAPGRPQHRSPTVSGSTSRSRRGWPSGTRTARSTSPSRNSRPPTTPAGRRCCAASGSPTRANRTSARGSSTRRDDRRRPSGPAGRDRLPRRRHQRLPLPRARPRRLHARLLLPQLHLDQPSGCCVEWRAFGGHGERNQPPPRHRPPHGAVPARMTMTDTPTPHL